MLSRIRLVLALICVHFVFASTPGAYGDVNETGNIERYRPKLSDFRLDGDQIIPEIDSSNTLIFSGSISAIPKGSGVDRFTAPPLTVVMHQKIGVRDASTGATRL